MSAHPTSLFLEDCAAKDTNPTKFCIKPIILRTPPPEYDPRNSDVEPGKVGGHAAAAPGTNLLKRALALGVTRSKVTYHGLDLGNLLAPVPPGEKGPAERDHTSLIPLPRSSIPVVPTAERKTRPTSVDGEVETIAAAEWQKTDKEGEACKGSLTGTLDGPTSEVPSLSASCTVTPHPSFVGPLHTVSVTISTLEPSSEPSPVNPVTGSPAPFTTASTSYGTFVPHIQAKKSNLTQAILELQQREWEAACLARTSATTSVIAEEENVRHMKTRPLPKPLLRGDGTAEFPPTESKPTTAISYAEIHPVAAALDISAVDFLYKAYSATEILHPVGLPSLADPGLRSQHLYHSRLERPHASGYSSHSSLRKRKRAPVAIRTVCNTGEEFSHLWRDDLSFVSIDRAEDDWERLLENQSGSIWSELYSPKIYSPLDGSLDGLGERTLDLLLRIEDVASEPPTVGMYCNECRNGKGMCFCYYELRVERCNICGRDKEFCQCWPNERLRDSDTRVPAGPGGRIGKSRNTIYVGDLMGISGLGLRIGGVALRGGLDTMGDSASFRNTQGERGRQRERQRERQSQGSSHTADSIKRSRLRCSETVIDCEPERPTVRPNTEAVMEDGLVEGVAAPYKDVGIGDGDH